jgi:tetratricopeptide (TPR) repeat protein
MSNPFPRLVPPYCAALVAWALVLTPVGAREDGQSWVGRRIILTADNVRIGHSGDNGQAVYDADLTDMVYRVLGEKDGWLRVRQRSAAGWFPKESAILLDEAIPYFTGRLRGNAQDALAYAHRGRAYQEKGDFDKALQDYDEAIRTGFAAAPGEPAFGPLGLRRIQVPRAQGSSPQASWYRNRGVVYEEKGDVDRALKDFAEAIRLNAQDPLTYVDRGRTYKGQKDYDRALADYSEAIRLDPRWGAAYFNRANAYKARKDLDRAVADYGDAIRLDPNDPDAFFNRANAYKVQQRYALAVRDLQEVIRLDPKDVDAHDALAWLLATCPDAKVRDGAKAVELAGAACELTDGKSPRYLATLAAAFAEAGRFDLAVRWQRQALESPAYAREDGARQRLQLFEDKKPYRDE